MEGNLKEYIEYPTKMHKFGYTSESDAATRFTEEYHNKWGFEGICLGRDYNIKILWSAWVTEAQARYLEEVFAEKYIKNFWTKEKYNGITECRILTPVEYKENLQMWYGLYPTGSTKRLPDLQHVYFAELTRKNIT